VLQISREWRWYVTVLVAALIGWSFAPAPAGAGTTGNITGTVTESGSGVPIANVKVSASSVTQSATTTTNAQGYYTFQQLIPDTYTLSFQAQGYNAASTAGIAVFQDQNEVVNIKLEKALQTIAHTTSRAPSNLVQGYTGTDVYNISGQQLNAAFGGDSLQKTLYQYMAVVPGVAGIGGGYPAEPSIRGGQDTDNGYEFDGVPIVDRILGFFTTNLSNIGIDNVEVYTGGLNAGAAANGTGIINTVVKTGTYPGFGRVSVGVGGSQYYHKLRAEYGAATPDRRWSWYMGFDGTSTENEMASGTFPYVQFGFAGASFANPGPVQTRDVVTNFHYRPNHTDDFQFLYANSNYTEQADYLLHNTASPMLMVNPCPGYVANSNTDTGASGGKAPDGQTCPNGLYFSPVSPYWGVYTSHTGGIGKLQWNHIINDHSSFAFHISENFNQYIFSQPVSDINNAAIENNPNYLYTLPGCPPFPYAPGSPVLNSSSTLCTHFVGDYYQDRNSRMFYAGFDYTTQPNANATIRAGVGQEYDQNFRGVFDLEAFNSPSFTPKGSLWPAASSYTDIPTHIPYAYLQGSFNVGRATLEPGVRYQRMWYGIPAYAGGAVSVGAWIPTFAGTYRINVNNVLRFSWGDTASFVGTAYVFRQGNGFYTPGNAGTTFDPQINHDSELMWEHQFADGTSLRVGPWYRSTDNYIQEYNPIIGVDPAGGPIFSKLDYINNGLKIRARGVELGINHDDNHPTGAAWWLAASYNNYWTTATALNSGFYNAPLPSNIQKSQYIRGSVPLIEATLTADLHTNGLHVLPFLNYSAGNFFNQGVTTSCSIPGDDGNCVADGGHFVLPYIYQNEQIAKAFWWANVSVYKDFGKNSQWRVGVSLYNVFNNQTGVTPCQAFDNTGCYPYIGPQTGYNSFVPGAYVYQNVTTTPSSWEFFLTRRL
jgi:hypothetical protein